MPTPVSSKWKFKHGVIGGKDAVDLYDAEIKINEAGTGYELKGVLTRTTGTSLPSLPFSFPAFDFMGYTWTITVDSFTYGLNGNQAHGTWSNTDPTVTNEESGTWTSQAGQDPHAPPAEEDAAGASA